MKKIWASVLKEWLVLKRDPGGLAMIFLMPVSLVIIMSLIQDAPFRDFTEVKMEIGLVDLDKGEFSDFVKKKISETKNFSVHYFDSEQQALQSVKKGDFKVAIVLSDSTSEFVEQNMQFTVQELFISLGMSDTVSSISKGKKASIKLLLDPVMKQNFKVTVSNALERMMAEMQSEMLVKKVSAQLQSESDTTKTAWKGIMEMMELKEEYVTDFKMEGVIMNSVQHNVPAWAMFAMFFILFPLAGNLIKEREDGSLLRVRIITGSYFYAITGKMILYFWICLTQFLFMLLAGFYVLPLLGLPKLVTGDSVFSIFITAATVAFAATSYGLLIALAFRSYHIALMLGSISVILMAAIGGVWIPSYIMPDILQKLSALSPLNWGLESFNQLFLRNAGLDDILPYLLKLFVFATVCNCISLLISKYRAKV